MSAVQALLRLLALLGLVLGLLLGACAPARADTAIRLLKSFNGSVNFTGTQATFRNSGNGSNPCSVPGSSANRKAGLTLPANATVVSAQLYWAGSGAPDYTVSFQGRSINAERRYTSSTVGNGMHYFSGVADVTSYVKGSGTYTFSGLTVANGNPWCASQAVLGGFALLVVYSDPNEPERVLNLYEGFQHVQDGEISFTATNFRWPRPWWPVREKARIGHITWEGDATLAKNGESLIFNGKEMTDDMNPAGNQFNSRSNINRDYNSYGIDFDAYDTEVVQSRQAEASVTTVYRTGQDLVLLGAEILVVPSLPISDLSIEMTRGGAMQVGQRVSYTLVVSNNGPYTESGPITITDTLPDGMSFVSASGVNWACGASGRLVTCTYKPALGPKLSAPALTIVASVDRGGKMVNTATVTGTADDNETNNTASNEALATAPVVESAGYVFTDRACAPKVAYPSSNCLPYSASVQGGSTTSATIWVTAVSDGQTMALSETEAKAVPMRFSLTCQDPATGTVKASYAGTALPACLRNGTEPAATNPWSDEVKIKFEASSASAAAAFVYADVGTVQLNLLANKGFAVSNAFTVLPRQLAFRSIVGAGGRANPAATNATGAGFVPAGEPFDTVVGALLYDGSFAPNFGREAKLPAVGVSFSAPAVDGVAQVAGQLGTVGDPARAEGGVAVRLKYSEVGIVNLTPGMPDYLASGVQVGGRRQGVGRFYPAYYQTRIETPPLTCAVAMKCDPGLSGAAYSRQPFEIKVRAYNADGGELKNFRGAWRPALAFTAVAAPGKDALAAEAGAFAAGAPGSDPVEDWVMQLTADFELPAGYGPDDLAGKRYTDPTAIYVRASSSEKLSDKPEPVVISSRRTRPEDSVEGGIMIVNGRLNVLGAQGVNTLPTPLRLQAQYWDGRAWLNHAAGPADVFMAANAVYSSCRRALKRADVQVEPPAGNNGLDNCNTALVRARSAQGIALGTGAGVFWLAPPGAGIAGSAWVRMTRPELNKDGKARDWLPSTRGRVNFGARRSPLIYLREVY